MPSTSELASRLANDLVQVGQIFGFEAMREEPVLPDSRLAVDVFWRLPMPSGSPFPAVSVACIEIQYSNAPTSVGFNIFKAEKTLHPAFHVVISYHSLSKDIKDTLNSHFPHRGLVVIDGEDQVGELNIFINRFIALKPEEAKLRETGKKILQLAANNVATNNDSQIAEKIRVVFERKIKEVFLPPEIGSLIEYFIGNKDLSESREIIDEVFEVFTKFVQKKLDVSDIPYVELPLNLLLYDCHFASGSPVREENLGNYIEINQNSVIVRTRDDYSLDVTVRNGTVFLDTEADTVCSQPLTSEDIIQFVAHASDKTVAELNRYEVPEEDKEILRKIIEVLRK